MSSAVEALAQNQYIAKVIPIRIKKDARDVTRALSPDPFTSSYSQDVIEPPYDLFTLAMMPEVSSELGPAIESMVVNIEKLGHRIVPRDKIGQAEDLLDSVIKSEKAKVSNFFSNAVLEPNQTFTSLRESIRYDLETTGNAYVECLHSLATGEPAGLQHLPSWQMRLRKEDDDFTDCEVLRAVQDSNGNWFIQKFPYRKRFRRYVQIRDDMSSKVYFKEWGDPRNINSETGDEALEISESSLATSVIHMKLYCSRSPYGIPRWIGNLFTIFGNRAAEVINYTTFKSNNIPAMILMATNVQLTSGSIERIQKFVEERIQGDDNYSTMLIVEGEPLSEGMRDPGTMKLEIKELTNVQHTDALFVNYMQRNDNKIRRAFRLPPIYQGLCVSIDTEFLTENGWKYFDGVGKDERIATINQISGELEFQIPTNRYRYDYDGQMFRFNNKKAIDALVTPNHRMMYRCDGTKSKNDKIWKVEPAYQIPNWHTDFLLSSLEWQGEERETFEIDREPSMIESDKLYQSKNKARDFERALRYEKRHEDVGKYKMDDFLEFVGYFVSEGSTAKIRGPIYLSQNSGSVLEKMKNVISRMGFDFSVYAEKDRPEQFNINLCYVPLWQWLRENCGVYSINKKIPREFLKLSRRQLKILYIALMDGDGSWCNHGREYSGTYSTTSYQLANIFQELCFRLGYRTTLRIESRFEQNLNDAYIISVSSEPINHMVNVDKCIELIRYNGEICCFTTPNSTIVTRRNGRILVSGNSEEYTRATAEASKRVAEEQIFRPERNHEDAIWNQTVIPALGAAYVVFRSNTPDVTDNYELTQLLAVAERSGGLSPYISRLIVEDVLGKDLPDIAEEIPRDIPFTLTMLREQLKGEAAVAGLSDDDVVSQLKMLKSMMDGNENISDEAHAAINTLVSLMSMTDSEIPKLKVTNQKEKVIESQLTKDEAISQKGHSVCLETVFKSDTDERIVGGAVLVPGVVDLQGDIYDANTVEAAAHYWLEHYMEDPKENGIKFMHSGEVIYSAARPIQSFVLDRDMEFKVEVPAVDNDDHPAKELTSLTYPKGTWILYARIRDDELWGKFKNGELTGWSIGGVALVQQLQKLKSQ